MAKAGADVGVYGFVLWLCTFVCYLVYLIWGFLPEEWLHAVGITYYPKKYWAVAVPAHLCFTYLLVLFVYWGINLLTVAPLDSKCLIQDEHSSNLRESLKSCNEGCVPKVADLPIDLVNDLLYQQDHQNQSESITKHTEVLQKGEGLKKRNRRGRRRKKLDFSQTN